MARAKRMPNWPHEATMSRRCVDSSSATRKPARTLHASACEAFAARPAGSISSIRCGLLFRAERLRANLRQLACVGVGRRREPACKVAHGEIGKCGDPARMLVEARNDVQLLAARALEEIASFEPDLLERLQAIRHEPWAEHVDARGAFLAERFEDVGRVRREPLRAAES